MSDRNRNKLPNNLPQLQNLVKRDPDSYKEEVSVWSGACIWQHSELSGIYTCSVFIVIIIIRSSLLGIPLHAPSTFLCLPLQLVVLQVCILSHPSIGQCRFFLGVLSADVHVGGVGFKSNTSPASSSLLRQQCPGNLILCFLCCCSDLLIGGMWQ